MIELSTVFIIAIVGTLYWWLNELDHTRRKAAKQKKYQANYDRANPQLRKEGDRP